MIFFSGNENSTFIIKKILDSFKIKYFIEETAKYTKEEDAI